MNKFFFYFVRRGTEYHRLLIEVEGGSVRSAFHAPLWGKLADAFELTERERKDAVRLAKEGHLQEGSP
jgi:hypothetical protein